MLFSTRDGIIDDMVLLVCFELMVAVTHFHSTTTRSPALETLGQNCYRPYIYIKISIGFQVTEVEKAISHPQIHLTRRDFLGSRPLILSQIKVLECGEPKKSLLVGLQIHLTRRDFLGSRPQILCAR